MLHIRYTEKNRPFQPEDEGWFKELAKLGIEIGYDYEYIADVPEEKVEKVKNILLAYKRDFYFDKK